MITAKDLWELQTSAPFQPFSIHMSDGRKFPVSHPELMFVTRNTVIVANVPGDEIPDRFERLSLLHVAGLKCATA